MTRERTSVLIDTDIFSNHLRSENRQVKELLEEKQ